MQGMAADAQIDDSESRQLFFDLEQSYAAYENWLEEKSKGK